MKLIFDDTTVCKCEFYWFYLSVALCKQPMCTCFTSSCTHTLSFQLRGQIILIKCSSLSRLERRVVCVLSTFSLWVNYPGSLAPCISFQLYQTALVKQLLSSSQHCTPALNLLVLLSSGPYQPPLLPGYKLIRQNKYQRSICGQKHGEIYMACKTCHAQLHRDTEHCWRVY